MMESRFDPEYPIANPAIDHGIRLKAESTNRNFAPMNPRIAPTAIETLMRVIAFSPGLLNSLAGPTKYCRAVASYSWLHGKQENLDWFQRIEDDFGRGPLCLSE